MKLTPLKTGIFGTCVAVWHLLWAYSDWGDLHGSVGFRFGLELAAAASGILLAFRPRWGRRCVLVACAAQIAYKLFYLWPELGAYPSLLEKLAILPIAGLGMAAPTILIFVLALRLETES